MTEFLPSEIAVTHNLDYAFGSGNGISRYFFGTNPSMMEAIVVANHLIQLFGNVGIDCSARIERSTLVNGVIDVQPQAPNDMDAAMLASMHKNLDAAANALTRSTVTAIEVKSTDPERSLSDTESVAVLRAARGESAATPEPV